MGVNLSTSMALPIPQVGNEAGPQYATDVNSCLTIVDGHNHSPGYGVAVPPSGLNINSDLTFQGNNLTTARTLRLQPQTSALVGVDDLGALYELNNDLFYIDGVGNQVRITQSGAVAGTPGSIANLLPPASASYNNGTQTFIFQSAANTPANIDGGSFVFRDITANSFGITMSAPIALAADYQISLFTALPGAQSYVTIDASGNLSATQPVTGGIVTANIANGAVTQPKLYTRTTGTTATAGNIAISTGSGNFSSQPNYGTLILSCTLTTTGRPVSLSLIPVASTSTDSNTSAFSVTNSSTFIVALFRDTTQVSSTQYGGTNAIEAPGQFTAIDLPSAGTYTYTLQARIASSNGVINISNVALMAYEIN